MLNPGLPHDVAQLIRALQKIEINGVENSLEDTLGRVRSLAHKILEQTEPRVPANVVSLLAKGRTLLLPIHAGDRGSPFSGAGHATRGALRERVNADYEERLGRWSQKVFGSWKSPEQLYAVSAADKPRPLQYYTNLALVDEEDGEVVARGHAASRLARKSTTGRLCVEVHPGVDPRIEESRAQWLLDQSTPSTSILRGV